MILPVVQGGETEVHNTHLPLDRHTLAEVKTEFSEINRVSVP